MLAVAIRRLARETICSMKMAKIANPKPIPKIKKAPIKSAKRMGIFLADIVRGLVLAKHSGACGETLRTQ